MKPYVITIARQYGSGGKTVGKMLAEKLQIPCYNREIITMASEDSGVNALLFSDERLKSDFAERLRRRYQGKALSGDKSYDDDVLFEYQAKVIRQLAEAGPCVLIGRCADYVLRDQAGLLRVMVHAPMEFRRQYAREVLGWTGEDKEMDTRIYKQDKARASYYEYYTQNRWGDVRHCDLALNAALGEEACVQALLAAYKAAK